MPPDAPKTYNSHEIKNVIRIRLKIILPVLIDIIRKSKIGYLLGIPTEHLTLPSKTKYRKFKEPNHRDDHIFVSILS